MTSYILRLPWNYLSMGGTVYEMELVDAYTNLSPRGAVVACLAHTQEVGGSNPSAETNSALGSIYYPPTSYPRIIN